MNSNSESPAAPTERFEAIVRERRTDETMVALIIDSPWLPGYAGANTLDFYFDPRVWADAYTRIRQDLPGVAFVPDGWVEFGMATEPSGWGTPVQWSGTSPPGVHHVPGGIDAVLAADAPDPETDGLMPAVLRRYERLAADEACSEFAPRMAAVRGPLAVASHLVGVTDLLMSMPLDPDKCMRLLDQTMDLCIRFLKSQLERIADPLGVLVLDDVVGMISPADAERFAAPRLKRIFDEFDGLIHVFHNDTPNENVYPVLAGVGIDVFNFSHVVDPVRARELIGPDIVLMGNVPPLDVLVRGTTREVHRATEDLLAKLSDCAPLLVSPGGGVSPGTPIENLQAMLDVVNG